MRTRPFLHRLTLAALGMLLLSLLGGIGLGWAVRGEAKWLVKLIGSDRCSRLYATSLRTLRTLLPADSDGDGLPDSVELYMGHDPHNPQDHPYLHFPGEIPGVNYLLSYALQPGERRRVHARASIDARPGHDARPGAFAPGMKLLLTPEPPGLLCLPGGTPSGEPLLVPVAADGAMEFDLAIRDGAVPNGLKTSYEVEATHPISDRYAYRLWFDVVWRRPPLACAVQEVPFTFDDVPLEHDLGDKELWHTVHLTWPPVDHAGMYYIEATRDQSHDPQWFSVGRCSGEGHDYKFSYQLYNSRPGYRGPLKFRIIPTEPIPPKAPDEKDHLLSAYRLREYAPKQLFQEVTVRGFNAYKLFPVDSIADSPESAKAIFQKIIATQWDRIERTEIGEFILPDVSQVEPTVCNGFYVFQVRGRGGAADCRFGFG